MSKEKITNIQQNKDKQKMPISIVAICLAIYFACEPLTFITAVGGMSVLKLVTIPILLLLVVSLFIGKQDGTPPRELRFHPIHLLVMLYLLWSTTTLLFYKTDSALTQLKDMWMTYLVLILATLRPLNEREKKLINLSWLFVGIVCFLLVMNSHDMIYGDRTVIVVHGSYEDPNQFCAYFIMPILVALEELFHSKNLVKRCFCGILVGLIIFAILKTGSRGGLIGVSVGIFIYLWFSTKGIFKKILVMLGLVVATLLAYKFLLPLMPEGVQNRLSVEAVQNDKGSGRFDIWQFLISYTLNERFAVTTVGHGLLSTETIMAENYFSNRVAHNQFVQCLFDQGIIGVVIYINLILVMLFKSIRHNKVAFAALCSILAFSMSLTFYTFKPMINIFMMATLYFLIGNYDTIER